MQTQSQAFQHAMYSLFLSLDATAGHFSISLTDLQR
jgi:hypothetical protein